MGLEIKSGDKSNFQTTIVMLLLGSINGVRNKGGDKSSFMTAAGRSDHYCNVGTWFNGIAVRRMTSWEGAGGEMRAAKSW
jgi:hypothetical protein